MKFFRKMYQKSKEQKGFTLVEMIVVLVIIAILAAITIPALLKYIDKAKDKQIIINARTAYLAAETAASEAYAAGTSVPTSKLLKFNQDTTRTATDVEKNACQLTGISQNYVCIVTVDSQWKITQVKFGQGDKTATLDVNSSATWTVSNSTLTLN